MFCYWSQVGPYTDKSNKEENHISPHIGPMQQYNNVQLKDTTTHMLALESKANLNLDSILTQPVHPLKAHSLLILLSMISLSFVWAFDDPLNFHKFMGAVLYTQPHPLNDYGYLSTFHLLVEV